MTLAPRHLGWLMATAIALISQAAHALPSYSRQTGMTCAACHVGGFGPQLTPAGVKFKLGGYTDSDGQEGKIPLSAMVVASTTHTQKANPDNVVPDSHLSARNNTKFDEASVFLAGRLNDYVGSFTQVTYDGIARTTALDHMDIRVANSMTLGGKDAIVGISFNNNPSVQDPFNTLPIWGYPYVASAAGTAGYGPVGTALDGQFEHRVIGANAYTLFDKNFYGELGSYRTLTNRLQSMTGQNGRDGPNSDPTKLGGNAYWRLAYMKDLKSQAFSGGVFGFQGRYDVDRNDPTAGRNKFNDLGVDATYQFLGTREHIATVNGSYVREHVTPTGEDRFSTRTLRLNASYHYHQTWGGHVGTFATRGGFAAADLPVTGGTTTRGQIFEANWTPWGKEDAVAPSPFGWANVRIGAQYWAYNKVAEYDGKASDKNTFFVYLWGAY